MIKSFAIQIQILHFPQLFHRNPQLRHRNFTQKKLIPAQTLYRTWFRPIKSWGKNKIVKIW